MDFLKAEIAAKRKAESSAASGVASGSGSGSGRSGSAEPPQKYQRRGEVERARIEVDESKRRELREARERRDRAREEKRRLKEGIAAPLAEETSAAASSSSSKEPTSGEAAAAAALTTARGEAFNISPTEAITRLRAKGQPIRLFGESDKERRLRLRALELIEERGERVGQNDFMRALAGAEGKDALEELERTRQADGPKAERDEEKKKAKEEEERLQDNPKNREGIGMDSLLDLSLVRKDVNRVYPMIYYTLKGLMSDWEQALAERPLEVRQSTQGKMVAATQVQSKEYMRPFFKALRQRATLPDVTMRVAEIVHHMQKRDYRAANDSYLQMSIGNAPWPIGVTMVGIHERSGREKIFSSNVAHVLNDEVSRKYIQSLKRLMTFAQTKYPPKDPSMLMG